MEQSDRASLAIENRSKIGQFLWIGFYTSILTVLTLTIYRFWARTTVRRRLWSETSIGGEPLEYIGKGSELFVGFLIAIFTVALPTVGALVAAQLLPPAAFVVVVLVVYLGLFILFGTALYLARRYQMSRTLWRGIRFEQRGSALSFGLVAFGYGLLSVVTLGWFAPAMRLRLERRFWSNAYYGDTPFAYDNSPAARTEPVYLSFILAAIGGALYYVILIGGMFALGLLDPSAAGGIPGIREIAMLNALVFGGLIVLLLFAAWHEAVMLRQITKSISFQGVSLRSRFNTWDLLGLAFTNILLVVFTLGFGAIAAQMRVWKKVCQRLEASGEIDFARIGQAATRGPKSGEGMVDAFDISGGI